MEHAGFTRKVSTGAVAPISNKLFVQILEQQNKDLIKQGKKIEFEVLDFEEGLKLYNEHVAKALGRKLVGIPDKVDSIENKVIINKKGKK